MEKTRFILSTGALNPLVSLNRALRSKSFDGARFFILTDANTVDLCLPTLISSVAALDECAFFELPEGEACKDIGVAQDLWLQLMDCHADRNAVIINLGGGALCDLGGFVAASYKRGIRFVNVPTTLLAMVDAAVGGKTAINVGGVKNQVGFFHSPTIICINPAFLRTLPDKELQSGLFEIIKTYAVCDAGRCNKTLDKLACDELFVDDELVCDCAMLKSTVAGEDFYDRGRRKILNFGHTLGHAIESVSLKHDDNPMSHGQAVGLGMAGAVWLSVRKTGLDRAVATDFVQRTATLFDDIDGLAAHYDEILDCMRADKKATSGTYNFVLLKDLGRPVVDVHVSESEALDALAFALGQKKTASFW